MSNFLKETWEQAQQETNAFLQDIEAREINKISHQDYIEIQTLLDTCFLDFRNECDLDQDRCVDDSDFGIWFRNLVSERFPFVSGIALHALARDYAEGYNNQ